MTRIYLVRHGETEWSRSGRHTSFTDLDLTENGVREAKALRSRLDPAAFDLVLCSPRLRARRTAELAGFAPEQLQITEDLAEWHYGDYEGLTTPQIRRTAPGWTIWTGAVPGGESAEQVQRRLERVSEQLRASTAERVACFAHGHSLRALTLTWLGLDLARGDQFPMPTGAIGVLGLYRDHQALLQWNLVD